MRRNEMARAWQQDDRASLQQALRDRPLLILRYLGGRLCSADEAEKWRAVRCIGELCADAAVVPERVLRELLRGFQWLLSDESGAVPFGVPEAVGEILVHRPEFQAQELPLLIGLLGETERFQTGPVLEGVLWALERVAASNPALPVRMLRLLEASFQEPVAASQAQAVQQIRHTLIQLGAGSPAKPS
ncbi:MAG: DVU0298 family protein [Pseudomonadota bacterium]